MIGTTVSHYKILEKIGEGGMGEVYLAEDTKLKRQVSLKFLPADLTRDETRKQRFIQEARAAAAIQHPHIAAVYDIDEADGRTFIAMEYIPGESLREVIESQKLNVRRSLELGSQIADGLAKAHEKGVVHRDMKPENVLVSEDGYAKIIDFGLAKLLEPLVQASEASEETETRFKTKEGLVMGTVAYMSPEQARGDTVDARSDIFSFGTLLYEMLSGNSPFRRRTAAESLSAVLKESPPPVTITGLETPAQMQWILRKALAKEPAERYQSMKDLALDVREMREEVGSVSRPAVVTPYPSLSAVALAKAGPLLKGERLKIWAAVAVGIVAVAALAFYLGGRRDEAQAGIGASGRPSIAVMYFEDHSGAEEIRWLSTGLPSMLVTGLAQTPGLDVVSSQRIHEILKQIGQEDLESIDKSLVADVARRAGAGAVVVGSIFKAGDEIRIDVQLEDVASGKVLSADTVRGTDVFPLVDELAGRIRTSLDLGDGPAGRSIADVTTPSLEAYQLYNEGLEATRNLRDVDARRLFEKALELDPSFAMAYFQLSGVLDTLGEGELSQQYREKAMENVDKLPERQQLSVRADYAHSTDFDYEKAVELFESLVTSYPDEHGAYISLQHIYDAHLEDEGKALDAIERGVKALPQSGGLHNQYGYQLLELGRYPEAVRELETYASLSPDEPNPHDSLGEAYLITGQPEKALDRFHQALEVAPSFYLAHDGLVWAYAMLGRYDEALKEDAAFGDYLSREGLPRWGFHFLEAFTLSRLGRYEEAQANLRQGIEEVEGLEDAGPHVALKLLSAIIAIETESHPQALQSMKRVERLLPKNPDPDWRNGQTVLAHLLAGVAEARSGNLGAARRHLESQSTLDLDFETGEWWHRALEGEIAFAQGDLAAAESAFAAGEPDFKMFFNRAVTPFTVFGNGLPFRDGVARVKKAQGDLAGAIGIYRKLNTPDIGNKWTTMLEPRFVLELARLLDETGDKEGARAEYQRFLELWKDADAALPELKEARAYLGE
jgi:tetratricopeptide (TPR) repeat protein/TolB-like protein/predicted Ser/Thr protein kinase